jgi:multiple sugar transport system permease protein
VGKSLLTALLVVIAAVMLLPIMIMVSGSFKSPVDFGNNPASLIPQPPFFGNYQSIFADPNFFSHWYLNSVFVVTLQITLCLIVTVSAAYAFAKLNFPLKNVLFIGVLTMLMVPGDTTLIGRFLLYRSLGIIDTHLALILPAMSSVLMLFMVRQFFMTLPKELDEAALIDGCSYLQIFLRIILPLSRPVIMTVVLFTFIWSWNDYTSPSIFISDASKQLLTVGLTFVANTENGIVLTRALAGSVLAIVPTVVLFAVTQRHFVQGISMTGIKG